MFKKIKAFLFENTTAKQTVAKNTIWLSISNFGGRAIKAVIVIYGARALGAADWGLFSYATTLAGFFTIFVDPGVNAILIRESGKSTDDERRTIFSTTLVMKFFILLASVFIILWIAPYFSTLPGSKALLPVVVFIILFDSSREFFSSLIKGMEKMEWDAGIFIITNICIVVFGFIFLHASLSPKAFAWSYAAGSAVGAIAAAWAIWPYFKKTFHRFSAKLAVTIIQSAWPFAIISALGLLLTNTDILIISWMGTATNVGVYAAGIRIIQVLYIVPTIVQWSTLPVLSRFANKDNQKFRTTFERALGIIFLLSVPLAIGGAILGTEIMNFVYGPQYIAGGMAFTILMITILFDYPAIFISSAIFAYNEQRSLIISSAIGGIMNVLLDLAFIPKFGIVGSAVATLIAQILSNAYLWYKMKSVNYFTILPRLKKVAAAGIAMGIMTTVLLFIGTPVLVNILLSSIVYILTLKLLKDPLFEETLDILPFFKKAKTADA
jgi:O-antigen/teichoic acid export membrane protein